MSPPAPFLAPIFFRQLVAPYFTPLDGPPKRGTFWRCVCKKWPSWGRGTDLYFRCVCGPARVAQLKILRGGTALYFFQIVECTENLFLLWIAIVDNAGLPSLSLQIHTVIICPKYHHNANICIKFNPFTWNTIQWNLGKSTREEGFYFGLETRLPQIWVLKLFEGSAWGFHF